MTPYRVEIESRARREIARLERRDQQRVRAAIELLAETPRPPGCVALAGEANVYRVRVGDLRILYEVQDARFMVLKLTRRRLPGPA